MALKTSEAALPLGRVRLGDRWLDLDAGLLLDATGAAVALRPQAFDLLCLLARHAGEVVTKELMFESVWPGLIVTDSSIAQAVKDVRFALGPAGHQLVRTVARRGYVLVHEVTPDAVDPSPLPALAGPLFGREADLQALDSLLEAARIVTVVGAGGVGKTRLALAAAHARAERSNAAVGWVDLASVADARLIAIEVAQALRLPLSQGDEPLQGLLSALARTRQALVVLDNAEHFVEAVATFVSAAVARSPELRFLVTSQAPLHVDGERQLRLMPLALPPAGASLAQALASPAVAFFVDGVRAIDHRFHLTPQNVAAVVELCHRLDGLPLALRLAAGRVHVLGLAGLLSHLADGLHALASPQTGTSQRQQTLSAALAWSYGLLAAQEQRVYRRLAVCAGGFDVRLALALCVDIVPQADQGMNLLADLVDRSLIHVDSQGEQRLYLLDTQRRFAEAALCESGEVDAASARLCDVLTGRLAVSLESRFYSVADEDFAGEWAAEIANLRAALDWSVQHDPTRCAWLAAEAYPVFAIMEREPEWRRCVALIDPAALAPLGASAAAHFWMARAVQENGYSTSLAHDHAIKAEAFCRQCGDLRALYFVLCFRITTGCVPVDQVDGLCDEIESLQQPGWPPRLACFRFMVDYTVATMRGTWRAAQAAADRGLELASNSGFMRFRAILANAAIVSRLQAGDVEGAWQRCCAWRETIGQRGNSAMNIPFLGTSGFAAILAREVHVARELVAELLYLCRATDWMYFERFGWLCALLALAERRTEDAARLLGYAEPSVRRARERTPIRDLMERTRERISDALDKERLDALVLEGAALDRDVFCQIALRRSESSHSIA